MMPKNNRPLKFNADIHVKLTKQQREWLEEYCRRHSMSFSDFVRAAIQRWQELMEQEG